LLSSISIFLSFTLLCIIELNVLLLNKLLQFMDLLTVQVDSHFVSCCNQVRMDLHLKVFFAFVTLSMFLHLLVVVRLVTLLHRVSVVETCLAQVVFFVVDTTLFVAILFRTTHHALTLQLFFAHLVESIFFIVPVSHNASDCLS